MLLWLSCCLPTVALGQIIGPERIFGSYPQFVWQDQHGLPQNGISAVAQTPDGYLWLATAEGVIRFDGVNFTAFDTGNTPQIKSNNIMSLLVDRSGTLWIGTHGGGLSRYQNGYFTNFSTAEGLSAPYARCLFEDAAGNLWVGTDGGGLNLFRDGKFKVYTTADGLPDNRVTAINQDGAGALWVGTASGLGRLRDERFTGFSEDGLAGQRISSLFRDRDGDLWMGLRGRLKRWHNGVFIAYGKREGLKDVEYRPLAQSPDGTLWAGSIGGGLYRFKDGRFTFASAREGLINDEIQAVFADPLGNIWLGTNGGGLAQLKNSRFTVYTTADGLPGNMVQGVFEDAAGGVWLGTDEGLCRYQDGKFSKITTPDGNALPGVNSLSQDRAGNLWIKSRAGDKLLKYRDSGATVEVVRANVFANRASVTLEDKAGNLWYGTSYDGLHRIDANGRETVFHKPDGLADEYVDVLYEARDGVLWIGTRHGLSRFKDGVLQTFSAREGFAGSHVLSFHEDRAGNLWIGTHGDGLWRFRGDSFAAFTTKNGLYDNLAFQILEDDNGNLWMSGNKGIYRASLAELEELAAGRRGAVNSYAYGSLDGMLSRECNGANPAGVRARDGRLWFPTIKGAVVIDPRQTDPTPARVSLEQVLVDNQVMPVGQAVEMQPKQDNLEFRFTALNWHRPSQIRFKYQLVGLDADWVEAGARRVAYYPHVPAGNYTFRVIADNGEGVWNYEGQSLAVAVLPPFYQTWWFFVLCALVVGLMIRLLYTYRLSQLKRINEAKNEFTRQLIASQEAERKRIAAELHDSLGQSLLIIKNRAYLGGLAPDLAQARAQLKEIGETAGEAVEDARDISHSLRPTQLERLGLTTSLVEMVNQLATVSEIKFISEIAPLDGVFTPEGEINFYRVAQEGLNNVIKHSEARQARLTVTRDGRKVMMTLQDNGKGFAPEEVASRALHSRSFGLTGLSERIRLLRGTHTIESAPGQGTTLRVTLTSP